MTEMLYANCDVCGNKSSYDKQSLKGSTWTINGVKGIVLCCPCEDSIFHQLLRTRISKKRMKELTAILMSDEQDDIMDLYDSY